MLRTLSDPAQLHIAINVSNAHSTQPGLAQLRCNEFASAYKHNWHTVSGQRGYQPRTDDSKTQREKEPDCDDARMTRVKTCLLMPCVFAPYGTMRL
jgi:hypothetical protein